MEKDTFLTYFRCFDDGAGNSVGKGSEEGTWIALQYEESTKSVPAEYVCSQWKKYIDNCIAEKTPDKFIMTMENFIAKGKYNDSFGATLKSKQGSFLDKYKTQPEDSTKSKIVNYLIGLPEGELLMEFENPVQQNDFVRIVKGNNIVFVEKYSFIIIQKSVTEFIKQTLNYIMQ